MGDLRLKATHSNLPTLLLKHIKNLCVARVWRSGSIRVAETPLPSPEEKQGGGYGYTKARNLGNREENGAGGGHWKK